MLLYYGIHGKLIFLDNYNFLNSFFYQNLTSFSFKPLFNLPLYGKLQFTIKISCIKIAAHIAHN